ncbi:MAG: hypothetical protein KC427_07785 [Sulfurovum sp.]|uniref:hypothetical protein n=1 Tax=Sulfurovum sp. TaxID=1969726 RepID=UPI002867FCF4|nr:hypothetical protein [Sulfurovum sp.]MCO4845901.1 hypothetical protein [Sulfurovum sp.]
MFYRKSISFLLIASTLFYLTGCGHKKDPVAKSGYYHSGIYFGKNFSANYQQGITDGCTTAKGLYRKSHALFNKDKGYNDGWFLGRNRCRHLLVIEDEKKEGN